MGVAIGLVVLGVVFIAVGGRLSVARWKRSDPLGFDLGIAPTPGRTSGISAWISFTVLVGWGMALLGLFGILGLWLRWF